MNKSLPSCDKCFRGRLAVPLMLKVKEFPIVGLQYFTTKQRRKADADGQLSRDK